MGNQNNFYISAPYVFLKDFYEVNSENKHYVQVLRQGSDVSKSCTVWCGSYFSSSEKNKNYNTYYEVNFDPFQMSTECLFGANYQNDKESIKEVTVFLESPSGCLLKEPKQITFSVRRENIRPVLEFNTSSISVQENVGSVQLPVLRSGDTSSSISVHCITKDQTAVEREDYEEKYETRRNSILHFSPEQKTALCILKIYDDEIYEGKEVFQVSLLPYVNETGTLIGDRNSVTVEITDPEDITVFELESTFYKAAYISLPDTSASVVIPVLRHGDSSLFSKIRISTIDGSASSGMDYHAKSKLFSFSPGEKLKNFEVEILFNKRRNWDLSFTVILGPDEVINAEIGNKSKATVVIPRVESTENLILPAVPVVVSLIDYDDVRNGMDREAKSGYPLVCVTPCDVNYPDYASTYALCRESGINVSMIDYSWEISMPFSNDKSMSPFEIIADSTLFTSAHHKILDSLYFRPLERVRCIVQPKDAKGHLGIPLRSRYIRISSKSGFCFSSTMHYPSAGLVSQPFIANLNYINSSDSTHPNSLHINVEIPHEDGLLPVISTYPLHNIEYLLTQSIYRQQHLCSNLLLPSKNLVKSTFLRNSFLSEHDVRWAFPHHPEQTTKEMRLIYQHLDLKKCRWKFDAWFSMSEVIEICGGTAVSDFKARDTYQTYISIFLPLYVTYVFAAAPTGWTSVEHRTEIEFSFFYDTFLWKSGVYDENTFNATLTILRAGTDYEGHFFFEFKTVARFYGCFLLEHHTLPGVKSHITAPNDFGVIFNLQLLWSEQTFDGPTQLWKATSTYSLKDYSGIYTVHLLPCKMTQSNRFLHYGIYETLPCIAHIPQKFEVPITFLQVSRPKPVSYSLETFFQLFNDKTLFSINPFENARTFQYIEHKGAFSEGDSIYGRVFWSPEQKLESAYRLAIIEVILCSGKNGYIPVFDPSGKLYGNGSQFGCLIQNKNMRHKFTLLDRHNPDSADTGFQGLSFDARFIEDEWDFVNLSRLSGVDGFVFKTDPLYEISSSQQWFIQVTCSIKPIYKSRKRRSSEEKDTTITDKYKMSIKRIYLNARDKILSNLTENETRQFKIETYHIMYIISVILILLGILILKNKGCGIKHFKCLQKTEKNTLATIISRDGKKCNPKNQVYEVVKYKQKVKHAQTRKVTLYSPKMGNFLPRDCTEI